MNKLPRIQSVEISAPSTVTVQWRSGGSARVDLAGWIATGGAILTPLSDPAVFSRGKSAEYGSAIAWDDDDLRIDALHLARLAEEQRPFLSADAAEWQADVGLSNREAADMLGIALSTWNAYKAGSDIPTAVALACRAARRDPILLQAHYRPRPPAGRPRKTG